MMRVELRPRVGDELAGNRLTERLDEETFLAVDALGREVALQVRSPVAASHEAFLRQATAEAAFDHPHAIPIYEVAEADGLAFVARRHVDGRDLRELLEREAPLDPARALRLLDQVASALDAAHAAGLVHGDVRAETLLVAGGPDREHCYLGFGAARQSEPADAQADVVAFARLLRECLPGSEPPAATTCSGLVADATRALGLDARPAAARRRLPRGRLGQAALVALALLICAAVGGATSRGTDAIASLCPTCVGVVDAATGRLVGEVGLGFKTQLIAAGEGFVWLTDRERGTLTKIDSHTLRVVATKGLGIDAIPVGLAAGEGAIWVALVRPRTISVLSLEPGSLEPRGETVLARAERGTFSAWPAISLALWPGAVWAFRPGAELWRIDPTTRRATRVARVVPGFVLAAGAGSLWLAGWSAVTRVDPRSGRVLEEIRVSGEGAEGASIAVGAGSVWHVDTGRRTLTRIDPRANALVDSYPVGRGPSGLAVTESAVWVANSRDATLSRLDLATGEIETIPLGSTPGRIAAGFGRIWTAPEEPVG
jgi:streptogramin lyase